MTENPPMGTSISQRGLFPILKNYSLNNDWNLIVEETFNDLFSDGKNLNAQIKSQIESWTRLLPGRNDRRQIIIQSTPFLMGVFDQEKTVRLYSPRLSQELFLIQEYQKLENSDLNQAEFIAFKDHVEKVASLSAVDFPSEIQVITARKNLVDLLNDPANREIEEQMSATIERLLARLNEYRPTLFERVSDFGLSLTAKFALIRIHLLKFLAILPSLDHDSAGHEVKRILLESLRRLREDSKEAKKTKKKGQLRALPNFYISLFNIVRIVASIFPAGLLTSLVRTAVRFMAKRFIAGETIETASAAISSLSKTKRDVTLDQLGELVVSEKEADHYMNEVLKLVKGFDLHVKKGEKNGSGIQRAHVSIKVSALASDFKPEAFDFTYELVAPRLSKILTTAKECDVFINIDAEHYHYRDVVFKIWKKVLLETPELKDFAGTGIVVQAYLRDASDHLEDIIELAKLRGLIMPVRLVKGAYWDAETVEAQAHGHNAPEFLNKEETDIHFRQIIWKIFASHPHLQLCLASHNFADHAYAEVLRKKHFAATPEIEHQCLHMTYEALSCAMAKLGWVVRNYVPIGSLIVGMAYLVRRIMENSSQVGVLTIMRSHKKQLSLVSPIDIHQEKIKKGELVRDVVQEALTDKFCNIANVRQYLEKEKNPITPFVETRPTTKIYSNKFLVSGSNEKIVSSSDPSIEVGSILFADVTDADKAVETAYAAYARGDWAKGSWHNRSTCLVKAANIMLAKRAELTGLIVYEAGKTPVEALGDVDEAIDFLNFYAREERKVHRHADMGSRGVVVAITPWNFPLAIPCGMIAAPLVTGNTVILKSAEQTPLIAQALIDIMHEAGVPEDVLIHLPGLGETVGDRLVKHDKVGTVVFTGSKNVGVMIYQNMAGKIVENPITGQKYLATAITEMGGKNALIVTENAELDETVSGILYSAFGHAGQKCSACSRVLVASAVKDRLIERLGEAVADLQVGQAFNWSTFVNPVITKEDQERLRDQAKQAIEEAKKYGGKVIIDRSNEDLPGYCVGPVVIELPYERAMSNESFAKTELFGPVLHVIGYETRDQALRLFNGTDYALTGGIFSQSQDHIDFYTSKMESGNLYINRAITGARVAIEPFGGFKLSGTGPKAGSRHYIPSFHLPINGGKVLSENAKVDEGTDYDFPVCVPSGLKVYRRKEKVTRGIKAFLHQFESLTGEIRGEVKDTLNKFSQWNDKFLVNYLVHDRPNRKIPGQLSFDSYRLPAQTALLVSFSKRPDLRTWLQFFGALYVGTGVSIVCRSQESYALWSRLISLLHGSGISKHNVDAYYVSEERLLKTLNSLPFGVIMVDGTLDQVTWVSKHCSHNIQGQLIKVLSPYDSCATGNVKGFLRPFIRPRSFAVNIMRHGAPLDIEV